MTMRSLLGRRLTFAATAVAVAVAGSGGARAESVGLSGHGSDGGMRRPASSLWAVVQPVAGEDGPIALAPLETVVVTPVAAPSTRALAPATVEVTEEAIDEATEDPAAAPVNDPLEPLNRFLFGVHEAIDMIVLRPVSFIYRTIVPTPLRQGVSNMVANAYAPVTLANDILQGDAEAAKTTVVRFMINSTAGFAGMVDAAAAAGLPRRDEDFGQTLGVWGVGPGPYVVVPVLGPTTVRDGAGRIVDVAFNPLTWILWDFSTVDRFTPLMAVVVTTHESITDELQAMRERSPDFYASVRDIYLQKRAADIANGAAVSDADLEPINLQ